MCLAKIDSKKKNVTIGYKVIVIHLNNILQSIYCYDNYFKKNSWIKAKHKHHGIYFFLRKSDAIKFAEEKKYDYYKIKLGIFKVRIKGLRQTGVQENYYLDDFKAFAGHADEVFIPNMPEEVVSR